MEDVQSMFTDLFMGAPMFRSSLVAAVAAVLVMSLAGCGDEVRCGPPLADAGDDITDGRVGQTVSLTCSARLPPDKATCHAREETLLFSWEQVGGPVEVTLSAVDASETGFVPTRPGDYTFRCKATFPRAAGTDREESHWDLVSVTVAPSGCTAPAADAGPDQLFTTAQGLPVTVTLDGSASHVAADCPDAVLETFSWSIREQPAGSDLVIQDADQAVASVDIGSVGEYRFEIEVIDSVGGYATDRVRVSVVEHAGCGATLEVTLIDMAGAPVEGAEVTVVDASGTAHTEAANADGVASFSGLAEGPRVEVTVFSDETVPAIEGSADPDPRPRYETTSVLDICSAALTVPMRLTASGRAHARRATVTARVPAGFFELLPHSYRCEGACTWNADCPADHYCEHEHPACMDTCTPRAVLPFYSTSRSQPVSGQFQFAMLVPALARDNLSDFDPAQLFAPRPDGGPLPGNLATNDLFLNHNAALMGQDVWGDACTAVADCPDEQLFACENGPGGDKRCRDLAPLRNVHLQTAAGENVQLFLLGGVMDVHMEQFLQVLTPFYVGAAPFDQVGTLTTFTTRTTLVCPLAVDVDAGIPLDLSEDLAGLTRNDCWTVTTGQEDVEVPLLDPAAMVADHTCATDEDCGWPTSGRKCMADPDTPDERYCLIPLFRVALDSDTRLELADDTSAFDPAAADADLRLQDWLPTSAAYQAMCDRGTGIPEPCDPPSFCEVDIDPESTGTPFGYGLSLAALDLPPGYGSRAAGARVVLGFGFHHTPRAAHPAPRLFHPPLSLTDLQGASLTAGQLALRGFVTIDDGSYRSVPGGQGVAARKSAVSPSLVLPGWVPPGPLAELPSGPRDAGLEVTIRFDPEDPLAECEQTRFEHITAVATGLAEPAGGTHQLPDNLAPDTWPEGTLTSVLLARVDRVGEARLVDPFWRIYAPAGTTAVALPQDTGLPAGTEIRVRALRGSFSSPFEYDLFPVELILRGQTRIVSEAYAVVAD